MDDDNIPRTPSSTGSTEGMVPPAIYGAATISYGALNHPQNTQTSSNSTEDTGIGVQYPHSRTNVTKSGHVIQYNDTPGGERVLVKHRTGSAVDMLPNGSMAISANGNLVMTINKDMTISIAGNARFEVNGDMDFDVKGNFNVNALNYNLNVEGNKTENIGGASRANVSGNVGTNIKGNQSVTTLGTTTHTTLGAVNQIAKGKFMLTAGADMQIASGGSMKTSAASGYDVAASNINIAGNSTTVVGATGTMGGAGVVAYVKNIYGGSGTFTGGVQAPTFHGSLKGTAEKAITADVTNSQNYADPDPGGGVGAAQGYTITNTAVDTVATALPNGALMTDYLTVSPKGIVQVDIDGTGDLYNMLDRTVFNSGLSKDALSTKGIRSKLRDEANAANSTFTSGAIAEGKLNPTYANPSPTAIGRASNSSSDAWLGNQDIGKNEASWIKPGPKPSKKPFHPDLTAKINSTSVITEKTILANGIPLSTFLRE